MRTLPGSLTVHSKARLAYPAAFFHKSKYEWRLGYFWEKSALIDTKRLILAILQGIYGNETAILCLDFGLPGDLRVLTENMMNEGRRLWTRDG